MLLNILVQLCSSESPLLGMLRLYMAEHEVVHQATAPQQQPGSDLGQAVESAAVSSVPPLSKPVPLGSASVLERLAAGQARPCLDRTYIRSASEGTKRGGR